MLAPKDQDREVERTVSRRRRWLVERCLEVERSFRRPSEQCLLNIGAHVAPCSRPVPVIDESGNGAAVVTGQETLPEIARQILDLGVGRRSSLMHLSQEMK